MRFLYSLLLYLGFPVIAGRLFYRASQDRRYFERLPQRLGFTDIRPQAGGVWVHAVSVGEVNAATPLIEYLLAKYPHKVITVTTMTPTGSDRVLKVFNERVAHCYLPYDYPGAVRRFLRRVDPCLGVVMETEIWPNLIARCRRQKIPLIYANVRLSTRAHRGYRRLQKLIRPALAAIDQFAVQNRMDAKRLIRLGASPDKVTVTGSIKFDIAVAPAVIAAAKSLRRDWGAGRPVWLAGSTHDGEEVRVLDAFARIRHSFKSLLLVIVPRHPQRFNAVHRLCRRRKYRTVLRSQTSGKISRETDIYLADTMGELPTLIAASDIAFIGGSLVPVGGHNVLEASAAGVPVVFGSQMFNFAEIADLLLQHAAGIQVINADELAEVVQRLLADPPLREQYANHGRELIEKNRGALEKICGMMDARLGE